MRKILLIFLFLLVCALPASGKISIGKVENQPYFLAYIDVMPNEITISAGQNVSFDAWAVENQSGRSVSVDAWSYEWLPATHIGGGVAENFSYSGSGSGKRPVDYFLNISASNVDNNAPYLLKLTAQYGTSEVSGYLRFYITDQTIRVSRLEIQPNNVGVALGSNVNIFYANPYDQFNNPIPGHSEKINYKWSLDPKAGAVNWRAWRVAPVAATLESTVNYVATASAVAVGDYTLSCTLTSFEGQAYALTAEAAIHLISGYAPVLSQVSISPESSSLNEGDVARFTAYLRDQNNYVYAQAAYNLNRAHRIWEISPTNLADLTSLYYAWGGSSGAGFKSEDGLVLSYCDRALARADSVSGSGTLTGRMTEVKGAAVTTKEGTSAITVLANPVPAQTTISWIDVLPSSNIVLNLTQTLTLDAWAWDDNAQSSVVAAWSNSASNSGIGTITESYSADRRDYYLTLSPSGRSAGNYLLTLTAASGESSASKVIYVTVLNPAETYRIASVEVVPAKATGAKNSAVTFAALLYDNEGNYIDPVANNSNLHFNWEVTSEAGTLEVLSNPFQCKLYVSPAAREWSASGDEYYLYVEVSFEGQAVPVRGTAEVYVTAAGDVPIFSGVEIVPATRSLYVGDSCIFKSYMKDQYGRQMLGNTGYSGIRWSLNKPLGSIHNVYEQGLILSGVGRGYFTASVALSGIVYSSITYSSQTHTGEAVVSVSGSGGGGDAPTVTGPALSFPTVMSPSAPFTLTQSLGTAFRAGERISGTIFQYDLNKNAEVTVYIYDLTGSLIFKQNYASGANGGKIGKNYINWNGKNQFGQTVANGVYLFKIVSQGQVIGQGKVTAFE